MQTYRQEKMKKNRKRRIRIVMTMMVMGIVDVSKLMLIWTVLCLKELLQ